PRRPRRHVSETPPAVLVSSGPLSEPESRALPAAHSRGAPRLRRGATKVGRVCWEMTAFHSAGGGPGSGDPPARRTEERPGFPGACRALGVWGPCRGPHVNWGALLGAPHFQGVSASARRGEPVPPWIFSGVIPRSATPTLASPSASRLALSMM